MSSSNDEITAAMFALANGYRLIVLNGEPMLVRDGPSIVPNTVIDLLYQNCLQPSEDGFGFVITPEALKQFYQNSLVPKSTGVIHALPVPAPPPVLKVVGEPSLADIEAKIYQGGF